MGSTSTGYAIESDRVHWHFADWKPTQEIVMHYTRGIGASDGSYEDGMPGFETAAQAKAWVAFAKMSHYDRASVEKVKARTTRKDVHKVLDAFIAELPQSPRI